jgi:hypothetical protein
MISSKSRYIGESYPRAQGTNRNSIYLKPFKKKSSKLKLVSPSKPKVKISINYVPLDDKEANLYYVHSKQANLLQVAPEARGLDISTSSKTSVDTSSKLKWRKLSNVISTVKGFHCYDARSIDNESDFDQDIKDYKLRLHENTVRSRCIDKIEEPVTQKDYEEDLRLYILNEILE